MGHHKPMHLPQHDRAVLVEERSEMPPCDYENDEDFLKEIERRDAEMDTNPSASIEFASLEEFKAFLRKL